MNRMTYKGFEADISVDEEDELFFGHLRDIPASVSFHGETYAALRTAMIEAVEDYIEWVRADPDVARRLSDAGLSLTATGGQLRRKAVA